MKSLTRWMAMGMLTLLVAGPALAMPTKKLSGAEAVDCTVSTGTVVVTAETYQRSRWMAKDLPAGLVRIRAEVTAAADGSAQFITDQVWGEIRAIVVHTGTGAAQPDDNWDFAIYDDWDASPVNLIGANGTNLDEALSAAIWTFEDGTPVGYPIIGGETRWVFGGLGNGLEVTVDVWVEER